jgi:hypothetical protein
MQAAKCKRFKNEYAMYLQRCKEENFEFEIDWRAAVARTHPPIMNGDWRSALSARRFPDLSV